MSKTQASKPPHRLRIGHWLRWTIYRPRVLLCGALLVAAGFVLPRAARFLPDLTSQAEFQFSLRDTRISAPGRWVPRDLVQQVMQQEHLPESVSLLDDALVERVAEAFSKHPWVANVRSVRKSQTQGLTVELDYREPVLMVATKRGLYPVDGVSVLLPPSDFSASDAELFPILRNVVSVPTGPAGTVWGDPVVEGGAKLAAVLVAGPSPESRWQQYEFVEIAAPTPTRAEVRLEDLSYELVTRGGSRILWGHPPGGDALEPTIEQKLGRLDQYVSKFGSLDGPDGRFRIDIRHFDIISLQRLSDERLR